MSRLKDFILGNPPVPGVTYYLGEDTRVLTLEDIKSGVVRITYTHYEDEYVTNRVFHKMYSRKPKTLKQKFEG